MSEDIRPRPAASRIALACLLDAVLVIVFATIGRASHAEALDPAGVLQTAWPFLAALAAGWLLSLAWRAPASPVRTGIPVWVVTVAGGMLLRLLSGAGAALPFVIVATLTLLLLLVGWRLIAALIVRMRR
ncbi:DUF3054 domain-containing protein [Microbacterium pseudoresistens]|uniref:DUF3054 domain-containing protein n=1 Tax=Microbacterium pseudoresistens TaxID=640634 RepID=A0A7Y9ES87_9MICO|nr:DUF3054 domain-containing protein [Microbacterium pseudoresistens]NYD53008.1 hypothetical protein [Microbacterium pseudoresistens]